jgi:hypothetical protein
MYFSGERQIEQFIAQGGKIEDLYRGKFNLQDLELINKIPGMLEAQILPHWLKQST